MRLYQFTYEVPGRTVKAPGISETELRRESLFYAADGIAQVWEEMKAVLADPEKEFVGLAEVAPLVTVLSASGEPNAR